MCATLFVVERITINQKYTFILFNNINIQIYARSGGTGGISVRSPLNGQIGIDEMAIDLVALMVSTMFAMEPLSAQGSDYSPWWK